MAAPRSAHCCSCTVVWCSGPALKWSGAVDASVASEMGGGGGGGVLDGTMFGADLQTSAHAQVPPPSLATMSSQAV